MLPLYTLFWDHPPEHGQSSRDQTSKENWLTLCWKPSTVGISSASCESSHVPPWPRLGCWLAWLCAGIHSCNEFMRGMPLSWAEDSFALVFLDFLSSLIFWNCPRALRKEANYRNSIHIWALHRRLFSVLSQVGSLYINSCAQYRKQQWLFSLKENMASNCGSDLFLSFSASARMFVVHSLGLLLKSVVHFSSRWLPFQTDSNYIN